jgi:hypothetical protein
MIRNQQPQERSRRAIGKVQGSRAVVRIALLSIFGTVTVLPGDNIWKSLGPDGGSISALVSAQPGPQDWELRVPLPSRTVQLLDFAPALRGHDCLG